MAAISRCRVVIHLTLGILGNFTSGAQDPSIHSVQKRIIEFSGAVLDYVAGMILSNLFGEGGGSWGALI